MGMRFRKSVKICKGVKINLSKSGASLSLGGRGHSLNVGRRGAKATVGLPGTGLSYSKQLTKKSKTKSSHSNSRKVSNNSNRSYITNRVAEIDTYNKNEEVYLEAKAENDSLINIHRLAPQVDKEEYYYQILNELKPPVYVRKTYNVPRPTEEAIRESLKDEAKELVHGGLFNTGRLRKEYVEENIKNRLSEAINNWIKDKEDFDYAEGKRESEENERYNLEFSNNRKYMQDLINGEDTAVSEAIESWIASCELPVEINVDYEWNQNTKQMYLDVDLPEIEDLPEEEVVLLSSGNLKEKKKTQTTIKEEYVNLVFGLAIFIAANVFNSSPAIQGIVISGYTQRRNKESDVVDEYVYSIKFTRDIFENSKLSNVNPKDFCMRFENRCNITSTYIMRKIEPYDAV